MFPSPLSPLPLFFAIPLPSLLLIPPAVPLPSAIIPLQLPPPFPSRSTAPTPSTNPSHLPLAPRPPSHSQMHGVALPWACAAFFSPKV
eukprot:6776796-Pyramimonas_sp.AAC.1